jgi:hypothetical protein
MTPTLYRATSVIDGWPHRGNHWNGVHVTWFAADRDRPPARWHELLTGDYGDPYARSLADELFTVGEGAALARYLKDNHGADVTITAVPLPLATREGEAMLLGCSAVAVGGDCDFYMLSEGPEYDLSLKVWGYYHMGAELRAEKAGGEWVAVDPPEPYHYPGYDLVATAGGVTEA